MIYVSWYDAWAYCLWLGEGYRLPAEIEWEFACRAGRATAYWFGDDAKEIQNHAWYGENSDHRTHAVGAPGHFNPWELYDMHGNVWEWTDCWYDPLARVLRGGAWGHTPRDARSAFRDFGRPADSYDLVGFRVARALLRKP